MKITHRETLPTNTASCHASTIEIWNGHPVFAWFGGTREGNADVCIYLYNLNDDRKMILLGNEEAIPRWNPILVNLGDRLILFEKAGMFCDRWQTFIHDISKWDANIAKKEIRDSQQFLPAGLNGPVKSRPLIKDGRMYCGSSVETIYDWTSYIEEYVISHDGLHYNNRSAPLVAPIRVKYIDSRTGRNMNSLGLIQPTLWNEGDDIFAFFRSSKGLGRIYYTKRYWGRNGRTYWHNPNATSLPNPNSAVDVATHNGNLYLVWNPSENERYPLVVSRIKRNGYAQDVDFSVEDTVIISDEINDDNFIEKGCNSPELSYPYMIEHNGQLHLTYTKGRSYIEYVIIDLD